MEKNESRKVYESREVKTYREMIEYSTKNYAKNIAYTYKKDYTAKEIEYVEKTYEQVGKDVKAFSTLLLNKNLEGKRVVLIGNNRYEWCITYFATTTGNMVIVPMDKALPDNEIESLVKRSEAEVAVFDKKYAEVMKKIKKDDSTNLNMLICMDEIEDIEIEKFSDLLNKGNKLVESGDKKYDKIKVNPNEMSIMLFTSGTTNEPKAVMLSQKNICANLTDIACWVKLYPTDRLLSFLPIHHTFECTITFLYGFYSGCTVAFCDGLKYIQKNLAEYKISIFVAVPLVLETMYKKITKAIEEKGKTKLINTMSKISNALLKCKIDLRKVFFKQVLDNFGGNLRLVLYGAAPMNKDTIVGFNNLGIDLVQGYGLTETSPVISAETDKEKRPGSVGLVLPTLEAKIINPDENGEGELAVKGPSVMMEYYKNDEENKKALKDGWFYTGDLGKIDENGYLYITGRCKSVIVTKNGKNIYPEEVEHYLNTSPLISEALVLGIQKEDDDETYINAQIYPNLEAISEYLKSSVPTTAEIKKVISDVVSNVNKKLPNYKHIKSFIIRDKEFEKTTTQKIKRYGDNMKTEEK